MSIATIFTSSDGNAYALEPGVNLSGLDLTGANLSGLDLTGANLSGITLLYANLEGCNFADANLINANLHCANLNDANLRSANLKGANLCGADLSGSDLTDCYMFTANLRNADFEYAFVETHTGEKFHFVGGYLGPHLRWIPKTVPKGWVIVDGLVVQLAESDKRVAILNGELCSLIGPQTDTTQDD
jgi:uncharacterized protein YjbI with pentapeptide repeats